MKKTDQKDNPTEETKKKPDQPAVAPPKADKPPSGETADQDNFHLVRLESIFPYSIKKIIDAPPDLPYHL